MKSRWKNDGLLPREKTSACVSRALLLTRRLMYRGLGDSGKLKMYAGCSCGPAFLTMEIIAEGDFAKYGQPCAEIIGITANGIKRGTGNVHARGFEPFTKIAGGSDVPGWLLGVSSLSTISSTRDLHDLLGGRFTFIKSVLTGSFFLKDGASGFRLVGYIGSDGDIGISSMWVERREVRVEEYLV